MNTQAELFSTVPPDDYFEIFEDDGKPRAQKIAKLLNYGRKDVSAASDMSLNKVRLEPNKIPKELAERIAEWGVALNLVASFFKDEKKTVLWFQTTNPMLGNISPADMIRIGRFKKLMKFIRTAVAENAPG